MRYKGLSYMPTSNLASQRNLPVIDNLKMSSELQQPIVHIVLFQYKSPEEIDKRRVAAAFMKLKNTCLLPDGSPYIVSIQGGANNSIEDEAQGLEHAFIVTFRNADEREYYVKRDPVHLAFSAWAKQRVAKVVIVDFSTGLFAQLADAVDEAPEE